VGKVETMYEIEFKDRKDYLFVNIQGPESYDAAVRFWEILASKARDEKVKRILVVDEVSGKLSTLELHKIGELVSTLFREIQVAFVDPKEETFSDNEFGETVIRNRSGNVILFRTEAEAETWLLRKQ